MRKNNQQHTRPAFKPNPLLALLTVTATGSLLANPQIPQMVHGQASFQQNGAALTVTNTPGAIINWQQFNINRGELTRFVQQNAASQVLNRVVGADPSTILGKLQSNGRVFLVNPNGIVFGAGAQVDVAGLVASTLRLSDSDFLNNRLRFADTPGAAGIRNEGTLTSSTGGEILLVAPRIENSGLIQSPEGTILLAAGRSVEVADIDRPNIRVEISNTDEQAVNLGTLLARQISIYGGLVQNSGRIQASTAVLGINGKVSLQAKQRVLLEPSSVIEATGAPGSSSGGEVTIAAHNTEGLAGGGEVLVRGLVSVQPQTLPIAPEFITNQPLALTDSAQAATQNIANQGYQMAATTALQVAPAFPQPALPQPVASPLEAAAIGSSFQQVAAQLALGLPGGATVPQVPLTPERPAPSLPALPVNPGAPASPSSPAGGSGAGGNIRIRSGGRLEVGDGAHLLASGASGGGQIVLKALGDTLVTGHSQIEAVGLTGGSVDVLGQRVALTDQASIDVSGTQGGGNVRIGGDYQGKNADVPNARVTYFGPQASIKADATDKGDGGKVIVWADDTTRAFGSISAKGGAQGGNGGLVETSGHRYLDASGIRVNTLAPTGLTGTWLLDPTDITITHGIVGTAPLTSGQFDNGGGASSSLTDGDINAQLDNTNVTITTSSSGTGSGDLTFDSASGAIGIISNPTSGSRTLELKADQHIRFIGSPGTTFRATPSASPLDVIFQPGLTVTGGAVRTGDNSSVTLDGSNSYGQTQFQLAAGKTWENWGILNINGKAVVQLGTGSVFTNYKINGIVNVADTTIGLPSFFNNTGYDATINNYGTINVLSGLQTVFRSTFNQSSTGELIVYGSGFELSNAQSIGGTVNLMPVALNAASFYVHENHGSATSFTGTSFPGLGGMVYIAGYPSSTPPSASFSSVVAPHTQLNIGSGSLPGTVTVTGDAQFAGVGVSSTGSTLVLDGGIFQPGNLSVSNGGLFNITNGTLQNSVLNTGTLTMSWGTLKDSTAKAGAVLNLTGGILAGTVNLDGAAQLNVNSGGFVFLEGVLNNSGQINVNPDAVLSIHSGGKLDNSGSLNFYNDGASNPNRISVGTGAFLNNLSTGSINSSQNTSGSYSYIDGANVTNAGTVNVQSGRFTFNSTGQTHSGSFNATATGAILVIDGDSTYNSSTQFNTAAGAILNQRSTGTFSGSFVTAAGGTVNLDGTASTGGTYAGNFTGDGSVNFVYGTNTLLESASGNFNLQGGTLQNSFLKSGNTLTMSGGSTLKDSTVRAGAVLNLTSCNLDGTVNLEGASGVSAAAQLNVINSGSYVFMKGVLNNSGQISLQPATTLSIQSTGTLANSGSMNVASGATLYTSGKLNVSNGSTFSAIGGFTNSGTLSGDGTLVVGTGGARLVNAGTISPGGTNVAGTLSVTGDVRLDAGSVLNIELGGTTAGTQHDVLAVTGSATLGGSLTATTINSFVPGGQSFDVITSGSASGSFATSSLPSGMNGAIVGTTYRLTHSGTACTGVC
ncbi:MAG: beta strand repeat-containing protein, partial [Rhodoferax sp.]